MKFKQSLQAAILIRRYKRFLADVELPDGKTITVHCPNSGSMRGCNGPGLPVMLSASDNPSRKYLHTLEMIKVGKVWVGVNTTLTNILVKEAIEKERIKEIGKVDAIRTEVKVSAKSRLDLMLVKNTASIYIEVKNCTLAENGMAMFPDAVTARGKKHLLELLALKQAGHEAVIFFCVQRMDAHCFAPARHIDPLYGETLAQVHGQGVKILVYQADVQPHTIKIIRSLPIQL